MSASRNRNKNGAGLTSRYLTLPPEADSSFLKAAGDEQPTFGQPFRCDHRQPYLATFCTWLNQLHALCRFGDGHLQFSRRVPEYLQGPEWLPMSFLDPARLWMPLRELKQQDAQSMIDHPLPRQSQPIAAASGRGQPQGQREVGRNGNGVKVSHRFHLYSAGCPSVSSPWTPECRPLS